MAEEPRQTLGDYKPRRILSSIVLPPVDADVSYDLSSLIRSIRAFNQFGGLPSEDPKMHLYEFVEICSTLKCDALCDDSIRLRLFPFSLKDDAIWWFRWSLPEQSITTWDQLATKFLEKYYPPSKLAKLRRDILNFAQFESETFYEAKERFQDLLRRCPGHELPDWHQAHIFFEGLTPANRSLLDVSIGGFLRENKPTQAYDLLDDMAFIKYQLQFDKLGMEKVSSVLATHTNTDKYSTIPINICPKTTTISTTMSYE
jgi:hypothetical protein